MPTASSHARSLRGATPARRRYRLCARRKSRGLREKKLQEVRRRRTSPIASVARRGAALASSRASLQEVRRRGTSRIAPVRARRASLREVRRRGTSCIASVRARRASLQEVRRRGTSRIAPVRARRASLQDVRRRGTSRIAPARARRASLQALRRRQTSCSASLGTPRDARGGPGASLLAGSAAGRAGRRPRSSRRRPPSSRCDAGRSRRPVLRVRRVSHRPGRCAVRGATRPRSSSAAGRTTLGAPSPPRRGPARLQNVGWLGPQVFFTPVPARAMIQACSPGCP